MGYLYSVGKAVSLVASANCALGVIFSDDFAKSRPRYLQSTPSYASGILCKYRGLLFFEVIEVIEEAIRTVMDTVIEKMIDVDFMAETLVFWLQKREVVVAAIREAMEVKFGYGKSGYVPRRERKVWFHVYTEALEDLCVFQDLFGIDCLTCGSAPACCYCTVECRCGSRHRRCAWSQGYRCKLRCSLACVVVYRQVGPSKPKKLGFRPSGRAFCLFLIPLFGPS